MMTVQAVTTERAEQQSRSIAAGAKLAGDKQKLKQKHLPISFEAYEVGRVFVKHYMGRDGKITTGSHLGPPNTTISIELWADQYNADTAPHGGWRKVRQGLTRVDNIIVGKPLDTPHCLRDISQYIQRPKELKISGNSMIFKQTQAFFQILAENAGTLDSDINKKNAILKLLYDNPDCEKLIHAMAKGTCIALFPVRSTDLT